MVIRSCFQTPYMVLWTEPCCVDEYGAVMKRRCLVDFIRILCSIASIGAMRLMLTSICPSQHSQPGALSISLSFPFATRRLWWIFSSPKGSWPPGTMGWTACLTLWPHQQDVCCFFFFSGMILWWYYLRMMMLAPEFIYVHNCWVYFRVATYVASRYPGVRWFPTGKMFLGWSVG